MNDKKKRSAFSNDFKLSNFVLYRFDFGLAFCIVKKRILPT
jgi:hypothetical protein